ncbi:uncharacterized protein [Parasteatoda tepidariorum]|uniref:uncharacterized protein n=1 Tax=Parasteatoda tepidariorum TaxID=114398 RepID=UPI0039BCE55B
MDEETDEIKIDIDYLKKAVGRELSRALADVAIRRPNRPIEHLAYYLIALHERELELQRNKKSNIARKRPPRVVSDAFFNEVQIVESVLSDIVDQCVQQYDPLLEDTFSDIDDSLLVDLSDIDIRETKQHSVVIGSNTHLNENIEQLNLGNLKNESEVFIAEPEDPSVTTSVYKAVYRKSLSVADIGASFHENQAGSG